MCKDRPARRAAQRVTAWCAAFGVATSCYAGTLEVKVKDEHGEPLARVAVYATATSAPDVVRPSAVQRTAVMDQQHNEFVPHVLVVSAGTEVQFPNNDVVSHHVYSFSPAKTFELGLYKGNAHPPLTFDEPGVVVLGCNIHDSMLGYILVVPTEHYAMTDDRGTARLENLPVGDYTLEAWTPRAKPAGLAGRAADYRARRRGEGRPCKSRAASRPSTITAHRVCHGNAIEERCNCRRADGARRAVVRSRRGRSSGALHRPLDELLRQLHRAYGLARRRRRQAALQRRRRCGVAAVPRVPRQSRADVERARRRRLRRRRRKRRRSDRGLHGLAPDPALGEPAAGALRRVLPAVLARERRARLGEPVHVLVLRDQHLARRGDSAARGRVVATTTLAASRQRAGSAGVRRRLLRKRPGRHVALLARLVAARPTDALERPIADSRVADLRCQRCRGGPDAAAGSAVHGDRSPPGRVCRRGMALRAPRARAAGALRQSYGSLELREPPVGLAYVVRSPRRPGRVAGGTRPDRAVDARRDRLAVRRAAGRHLSRGNPSSSKTISLRTSCC